MDSDAWLVWRWIYFPLYFFQNVEGFTKPRGSSKETMFLTPWFLCLPVMWGPWVACGHTGQHVATGPSEFCLTVGHCLSMEPFLKEFVSGLVPFFWRLTEDNPPGEVRVIEPPTLNVGGWLLFELQVLNFWKPTDYFKNQWYLDFQNSNIRIIEIIILHEDSMSTEPKFCVSLCVFI